MTVSPAPHVLDHLGVRLHPLLLRAQDQEIHDHENEDERQQRHQHAAFAAQRRRALGKGGRYEHLQSSPVLLVGSGRKPLPPLPISRGTIAGTAPIATLDAYRLGLIRAAAKLAAFPLPR